MWALLDGQWFDCALYVFENMILHSSKLRTYTISFCWTGMCQIRNNKFPVFQNCFIFCWMDFSDTIFLYILLWFVCLYEWANRKKPLKIIKTEITAYCIGMVRDQLIPLNGYHIYVLLFTWYSFLIFFNIYVFIVSCQGIISNLSSTFSTNIYILYYFSLISVTANQFEQF